MKDYLLKKKIKILLIGFLIVIITYIVISILILPGNKFIYYYYPSQVPLQAAKENGSFVAEISPSVTYISDTILYDKLKGKLLTYLCKDLSYKRFGIIQFFKIKTEDKDFLSLNISKVGADKLYVQFNDLDTVVLGDSNSEFNFFKKNSDVTLKIFDKDKKEIVIMDFLNLGGQL